jgi:hypothetical protein
VATADPDGRGIRVGYLSKLELGDVGQVAAFPAPLRPIQVDDTANNEGAMGRPALVARITTTAGTGIDLVTCHLKSKLLTFPNGAFSTPATKPCGPATARMPSTGAPPKPSPSATPRPSSWGTRPATGRDRAR